MFCIRFRALAGVVLIAGFCLPGRPADLRITLPKHSQFTPVQRLNREGVEAVRKQQFDKAEGLFYKAYLYDPGDPFTLNNLGYIAELQGNLDRAQKFYKLASEQHAGNALISLSSAKQLEGKPMRDAFESLKDVPMRVNRMNVEAMELLSESRNSEADAVLQQALALGPHNPFTLNNVGVAKEAMGDYEEALRYYRLAADSRSNEPVIVTLKQEWQGRPVSAMATYSERQLKAWMQTVGTDEARAQMFTVRGVSATNRNDWEAAEKDFLQAYSLNPGSAFSLNNRAYIAEKDGDLETARLYYTLAGKAVDANQRIGLATQQWAEGKHLESVAAISNEKVSTALDQYSETRRREARPPGLLHRDGSPAVNITPLPADSDPSSHDLPAPTSPTPDSQPIQQPQQPQ